MNRWTEACKNCNHKQGHHVVRATEGTERCELCDCRNFQPSGRAERVNEFEKVVDGV
jgi:hypothetical protein